MLSLVITVLLTACVYGVGLATVYYVFRIYEEGPLFPEAEREALLADIKALKPLKGELLVTRYELMTAHGKLDDSNNQIELLREEIRASRSRVAALENKLIHANLHIEHIKMMLQGATQARDENARELKIIKAMVTQQKKEPTDDSGVGNIRNLLSRYVYRDSKAEKATRSS